MRSSLKRRALVAGGLAFLLVGLWMSFKGSRGSAENTSAPTLAANTTRSEGSGTVSAVKSNPVKKALYHSSWQIVARGEGNGSSSAHGGSLSGSDDTESAEAPPAFGDSDAERPPGTSAKLSLEFVRANFDAAGMRGVRRFAAFSPPQYAAIKTALERRSDTEISAAPAEYAAAKQTVGFDLSNAADGRRFSIDFTPEIAADGMAIRLKTVTRGTRSRRDGTLPIWDGQTVMILLGDAGDKHQIAAFVTVRLTGDDGRPVNEFIVSR